MKRLLGFMGVFVAGVLGCGAPTEEPRPPAQVTEAPAEAAEQDIIGGWAAYVGQFPYQARIMVNGGLRCSGAIVSAQWVVTAAHCVAGVNYTHILVHAGDISIPYAEYDEQVRFIVGYAVHPSFTYVAGVPLHDVAVIMLASPLTLGPAVGTIGLPTTYTPFTALTVSGWGFTGIPPGTDSLLYASLPNNGVAACNGWLYRNLYPGYELCVGYANGSRGACDGDGGAPVTDSSGSILHGVVSWFRRDTCRSYTVATDLFPYVAWIRSYTGQGGG